MDSLKKLKKVVESVTRVSDIESKTRKRRFVYARYIYMNLAVEFYNYDPETIGYLLKRDRSTVITGLKTFKEILPTEKILRTSYEKCLTAYEDFLNGVSRNEKDFIELKSKYNNLKKEFQDFKEHHKKEVERLNLLNELALQNYKAIAS